MRRTRVICVWIVIVAVLLAGPVGSLAECLRCPPDCPMHAAAVERAAADRPDAAAHHDHHGHGEGPLAFADHGAGHAADAHAEHHGHGAGATAGGALDADSAKPRKCHESSQPVPKPEEGPCLSGVCGHMDPSHARLLPDGVLGRPKPLAPVLVTDLAALHDGTAPAARAVPPPTEPPRALSA